MYLSVNYIWYQGEGDGDTQVITTPIISAESNYLKLTTSVYLLEPRAAYMQGVICDY